MGTCHWQVASLIHTVSVYLIWWGFICFTFTFTSATSARASSLAIHQECFHVDGHVLQPEHHKHCRQKHYLSPPASPPPYFHCIMLLLPTSLDTPSFSPSAMNSLSTDCIVLTTCFSSSSSCIHTRSRCQQSPPARPRSHQDCTWTVMVSKIAELLPSCSPAWSTSPPCPPPMWLGFTSSPALPRLSNETMHFQCMGGHKLVHTVFYSNYLIWWGFACLYYAPPCITSATPERTKDQDIKMLSWWWAGRPARTSSTPPARAPPATAPPLTTSQLSKWNNIRIDISDNSQVWFGIITKWGWYV